jgi:hypothetical protein
MQPHSAEEADTRFCNFSCKYTMSLYVPEQAGVHQTGVNIKGYSHKK